MRYIEWAFLFLLSGLGIALANFVGFHVAFTDSLPCLHPACHCHCRRCSQQSRSVKASDCCLRFHPGTVSCFPDFSVP